MKQTHFHTNKHENNIMQTPSDKFGIYYFMMKANLVIATFATIILVFKSCDYSYSCYIANEENKSVVVRVFPPFNSFKDHLPSNYSEYFNDYIVEENFEFTKIEIPPKTKLIVFSNLGVIPHLNSFHINKIEIYTSDTIIILDSKEKIISAFEKDPKKRVHKIIIE